MTSIAYSSLSAMQSAGYFDAIDNEAEFTKLCFEIKTIRRKMMVLPTARESEALPDLIFTSKLVEYLNNTSLPALEKQLTENVKLQKLFFEDYLQGVCIDGIKARVYNNKEIVRVLDSIFSELVSYSASRLATENSYLYNLVNTILDKSVDYYSINGKESNVFEWAFGEPLKANEESEKWLKTLQMGELIDCQKSHHFQKIWSRAFFEGIKYSVAKVRFIGDLNPSFINNPEVELAKLGSKSSDFQWRENLQVGDLVDYYHPRLDWSLYKVSKLVIEVNKLGEQVKFVELEKDPLTKLETMEDISSKKPDLAISMTVIEVECSSEFAENESQISPVKVHAASLALPYSNSSKKEIMIKHSEDYQLLEMVSQKKHAILRPGTGSGSNSIYFTKYINMFGNKSGFEFLVDVASRKIQVKQETVVHIIQLIRNFSESLVEPFVQEHGADLLDWVIKYIETDVEPAIRTITQNNLLCIIDAVSGLSKRVRSQNDSAQITNEVIITIGLICLRSEILEKQFFGAKKIIELEEKIRNDNVPGLKLKLAEMLAKDCIFDKIIRSHPNLIEKAIGIFKILFDENKITEEQLASLWDQICKTDSESKSALIGIVKSISAHISSKQISFFLNKMIQKTDELTTELLEMLLSLRIVASNKHKDLELIGLLDDLLWRFYQSEQALKVELKKELLQIIVKNVQPSSLQTYFVKATQNFIMEKNINRNLNFIIRFLNESECLTSKVLDFLRENRVIEFCISKVYQLLNAHSEEHMNDAAFEVKTVERGAKLPKKLKLQLLFKLFSTVMKSGTLDSETSVFKFDHFSEIFEVALKARCMQKRAHDWFYFYLREEKCESKLSSYQQFFLKNLDRLEGESGEEFFKFFLIVFLNINEITGAIRCKRIRLESCSDSNTFGSKTLYLAQEPFSSLFGAEQLWALFLKTSNKRLYLQLGNFIASFNLLPEYAGAEDFEFYQSQKQGFFARAVQLFYSKELFAANKASILLVRIVKNEELKKGSGIFSFGQLNESDKIVLFVEKENKYNREKLKYEIPENKTVYWLKEHIAKNSKIPFEAITIFRENNEEINQLDNILTLAGVGLYQCEILSVKERGLPELDNKISNDEKTDFSPQINMLLEEIFSDYSENGRMDIKQMNSVISKMNIQDSDQVKAPTIEYHFRQIDKENRGFIQQSDFISYLREALFFCHSTLKFALVSLGYIHGFHLKRYSIETNPTQRRNYTRVKLASDELFYKTLLNTISSKYEVECSESGVTDLKDPIGGIEHCIKLFELLPPGQLGVYFAFKNPVQTFVESKNVFVFWYNATVLNAIIFKPEFLDSLNDVEFQVDPIASSDFITKVSKREWFEEMLTCLKKNVQLVANKSEWLIFLFAPLRLLERILKAIVSTEDQRFLQSMKHITHYLFKKRGKMFDKVSQYDDSSKTKQKTDASKIEESDSENEVLSIFIKKLEQLGLTQRLKNSFPVSQLNSILIGLFDIFNSLKEDVDKSQRSIFNSTIVLFIASVKLWEQELLTLIDQDQFKSIMIESLTSDKNIIRYFSKNMYSMLATETQNLKLKIKLFKVLISTLGSDRKDDFHSLVEFACTILAEIAEMKNQSPENEHYLHTELNFLELFGQFKNLLFSHETPEASSEDGEDNLLISYLTFLEKILKVHSLINTEMKSSDKQELIAFIFKECLFFIQSDDFLLVKSKCKTKKSRAHAFELLKQLLKNDISANVYFIVTCLNPLSKVIPTFQVQNAITSDPERRSRHGFVGIKNLGCVCYMIATLQQFYCTPVVRYGILMASDGKNIEHSDFLGRSVDDNVFHQFQKMMSYLDKSERKDYSPEDFCFAYKDHSGRPTNVMIQQDADEFLKVILEKIENSLKNTPFIGVLNSVYLGKICNVIKCKECGYEKTNEENFYNLSLEVKKMSNITESFDKLIEEETISDYMCDSCKKKCDISKQALLKKLPNVLILSLKKMCFDLELLTNIKIHSRYEFPMEINLEKYIYRPKIKETESSQEPCQKIEKSECEYKLIGVVIHKGNAEFGHYTSLINANRGDPCKKEITKDKWFEFDDSRVTPFDMRNFEDECFGPADEYESVNEMMSSETMVSKSAYLLMYEKIKKDPVVFPFNAENITQQGFIMSNLIDPSDCRVQDNNLITSFYNINQYLPESYKAEIVADNKQLILEQQLLSKIFTNGIAEIVQNAGLSFECFSDGSDADLASKKMLAEGLLNTLPKVISKVYTCAHENARISNVVQAIEQAMNFLTFCKTVRREWSASIDLRIAHFFNEELYSKITETVTMIITTSDIMVKNGLIDFIVGTVNGTIRNFRMEVLAPAEDDTTDIRVQTTGQVYSCIRSFLVTVAQINEWTSSTHRLGTVFGIVKRLGESNDAILKVLAENEFLIFLKELYIKTDSSRSMGGERVLVSILGNIKILFDYESKRIHENEVFASHIKQFDKTAILGKALKENYKLDSYDELKGVIRTFCTNDRETTEITAYYCLKNILNRQELEMIGQLESLKALLMISDEFSSYRIRIVFGIPRLNELNVKKNHETPITFFGLGRDRSLKSSVNEYVSPFGLEKGLLQVIWESKESFTRATSLMIFYVIDLMLNHDEVLEYICKISPPNYLSASFYDWFFPFCISYLKSIASVHSMFKSEFEVLFAGLLPEKLASLKLLIADKIARLNIETNAFKITATGETPYTTHSFWSVNQANPENDLPIFAHRPIYLIGETSKTRIIKKSVIRKSVQGTLKLKFRIANVCVGESLPTGTSNLFFPRKAIKRNFQVAENAITFKQEKSDRFLEKPCFQNAQVAYDYDSSLSVDEVDDQTSKESSENIKLASKYKPLDFVFSILCNNSIEENYLLRVRIEKTDSFGFSREEVLALILFLQSEKTIYSLTLPTLNDNFDTVTVFASYKVYGSSSLKDYTDEGFSEWSMVFDAAKDFNKEDNAAN